MSKQHINAYQTHLARLHAASGSLNEGVVSKAFGDLLERMGRGQDLVLVPQWEGKGPRGNAIRIDGALVPGVLRVPFGFWEAKDSFDDIDKEIADKRSKGYPDDNIIYEKSVVAVLRQNGIEIERVALAGDDAGLLRLLKRFFEFERPEIAEFRKAAAQFRADLPQILGALREAIAEAESAKPSYAATAAAFLKHAREAINPAVTADDVREMLIQHILTEEIFTSVFDNAAYHRENNVAQRLAALEAAFFTGTLRHATTQRPLPYYNAIKHAATGIADRREKQVFLKKLYEDFYKVYNPKTPDRLGVVYTPGEIVRFMIRGADWLCERHFGKSLIDAGVEILDPATGTGTFIVELLEHFQGDREKLRHKYKEELHANEVAILPYYVANLNIEASYAAITGQYAEFPGLVFVDTLDNTAGLGKFAGYSPDLFGSLSDENMGRIKRQNDRKISVIIGYPPYNAWQENYNSRNPNRLYKRIDERIEATYRALRKATNTSALSDMYVRFFRWASDRMRDDGVLALVTNRNFIEKLAFDGFRKSVANEFSDIWIVDLGGDVRANPRLSGTTHNVFGIQTGVTIVFLVKRSGKQAGSIRCVRRPEDETAREKLAWLDDFQLSKADTASIKAGADGVRLNQGEGGWAAMLPIVDAKAGPDEREKPVNAIFRLVYNGVTAQRDEWVWGWTKAGVTAQVDHQIVGYESTRKDPASSLRSGVKWDRELDLYLRRGVALKLDANKVKLAQFRPFVRKWLYFDKNLNAMRYRLPSLFSHEPNPAIGFLGIASANEFAVFATDRIFDSGLVKAGNGRTQGVTRYRYTKSRERVDNITDWALTQFRTHYAETPGGHEISKDDILAYSYAALHDPVWRETYAADLRRSFPRIAFHADFARWRDWGLRLPELHIGYESVAPFGFGRADVPTPDPSREREGSRRKVAAVVVKLRSEPENGVIVLDSQTRLTGVPRAAWDYRLGNRSAIDWVLDQHKEKTPRDPVVRERFNTYRFADHKDRVIDLLDRVVTVSVETVAIVAAMRAVQGAA